MGTPVTAEQAEDAEASVKERTHPVRRVGHIVFWALVLATVALAVALVGVPALAGGKALIVQSGSMEPTLPVGTAAVIKEREQPVQGINSGDVITFADADAGDRLVTHRVEAIERGEDGPRLITKGDANQDVDPGYVRPADVRGELWYQIPWVGQVLDFVTSTAGLLYGAAVVLLVFTAHLLLPKTSPGRT